MKIKRNWSKAFFDSLHHASVFQQFSKVVHVLHAIDSAQLQAWGRVGNLCWASDKLVSHFDDEFLYLDVLVVDNAGHVKQARLCDFDGLCDGF